MMKTLNGKIVIKEDIPVSPDDNVTIRIEDGSLMDVASVLIAEKRLVLSDGNQDGRTISFSMDYDETKIEANRSYSIRAVIRDKEGKLLWITDTDTPVFTRGGPCDNVNVTVKRVSL
jgi:putative lipoprotein